MMASGFHAQGLQDAHAKVRWAACQAVGQLCTDLGPELQEAEHARLLPGLMAAMDDFAQARVQAHAAAALVNFSENCEQVRGGGIRPSLCSHTSMSPEPPGKLCFCLERESPATPPCFLPCRT